MRILKKTPSKDPWIPRIVVGALALVAIISTGGALWSEMNGNPVPDIVSDLATDAFIILTMLAPRPKEKHDR